MTSVTSRSIVRSESSVTPSSLTESRNGTTVPVMSMPLTDGILSRWALVPSRTASVLAGLRSSPFSRNQRATSSTHSKTAVKVTSALGRTAIYNCVLSAYWWWSKLWRCCWLVRCTWQTTVDRAHYRVVRQTHRWLVETSEHLRRRTGTAQWRMIAASLERCHRCQNQKRCDPAGCCGRMRLNCQATEERSSNDIQLLQSIIVWGKNEFMHSLAAADSCLNIALVLVSASFKILSIYAPWCVSRVTFWQPT